MRPHSNSLRVIFTVLAIGLGRILWHEFSSNSNAEVPNKPLIESPSQEKLHQLALDRLKNEGASSSAPSVNDSSPTATTRENHGIVIGDLVGTVKNATMGTEARALMHLRISGSAVSGCFVVLPPLYGSGPITGKSIGTKVQLEANSTSFVIDFEGKTDGNRLTGNYEVQPGAAPHQVGTFAMVRPDRLRFPTARQDCPNDSDPEVSNGTFF
jgi:hypothetical protein